MVDIGVHERGAQHVLFHQTTASSTGAYVDRKREARVIFTENDPERIQRIQVAFG